MEKGTQDTLIKVGAYIAGYFVIGRPILKAIGILTTTPGKAETLTSEIIKKTFATTGWEAWRSKFTQAQKLELEIKVERDTKTIKDAPGFFNDNEDAVYSIFSSAPKRAYINFLAWKFERRYGKNMLAFINDFMSEKELFTLKQIIEKVPA